MIDSNHRTNLTRLLLLLLILLLGMVTRLDDLDGRSLWADEGWTVLLSAGPGADDVTLTMVADQHPPLFFALLRGWRDVTGDTVFALRYFSVLSGVVAVALLYQLGRELFTPAVGLIAALLLAFADNHIDLSQEVRHYALLATLVILSSLMYARWWRAPNWTNRISYVLASIALLYTHYLGGYVLIAQLLHMLACVRPRRRLFDALFLFGAICLGFLPWFPVVIAQNNVRWDNPLFYQNALGNSVATYLMVRDAVLGQRFALLLVPVLLGLVAYSRPNAAQRPRIELRPRWPVIYLLIWISFMVGLTVALNARREFLTVRNFILITPAILLLAARGLTNVPRNARLFTLGLLLVVGLTTVDARRDYPDWNAVAHTVSDHYVGDETIFMDVWVGDFPLRYYLDQQLPAAEWISLREWRDTYKAAFLPELLQKLREIDACWLIYWGDDPLDEYGSLFVEANFQRTATLVTDHHGTPIYSYRYDRLPPGRVADFGDELFALQRFYAQDTAAAGETLTVSLWWTALHTPALDYSVSVFLLNAVGELVTQHDGPPLDGLVPTSQWLPGELQYDTHRLELPAALPPGEYQLGVKVYWYGDNQPLPATTANGLAGDFAPLMTLTLK